MKRILQKYEENEMKRSKNHEEDMIIIDVSLEVSEKWVTSDLVIDDEIDISLDMSQDTGVSNYKLLKGKPSINGTELVENYDEIDPTVPDWAKQETKPEYSTAEIGAVDKAQFMTTEEINSLFDAIFN